MQCYLFSLHLSIILIVLQLFLISTVISVFASNDDDQEHQYHIQTDEGPERYFRYMTLNGQYRKEKRLEDGSVVGSYGWVDDDGMLRLNDYIADNSGYRIVKSKNVWVGKDTPMNVALKTAKKAPESALALTNSIPRPNSIDFIMKNTIVTPKSAHYYKHINNNNNNNSPLSSVTNSNTYYYDDEHLQERSSNNIVGSTAHYSDAVPSPTTPFVQIIPNAEPPSNTVKSSGNDGASRTPLPPTYYSSSTTSTTTVSSLQNRTVVSPTVLTTQTSRSFTENNETIIVQYITSSSTPSSSLLVSTAIRPVTQNEIENLNDQNQVPGVYKYNNNNNGPTYPIDENGHIFTGKKEYNHHVPIITNDGFRYYLPKSYHEEQSLIDNSKVGSFGYVDPFGIERVVYYNANPQKGFTHEKQNRYVGVHATPYVN